MQNISWLDQGAVRSKRLPPANVDVVPGVCWGRPDEVLSPAFWALQAEDSRSPTHGYIAQQGRLIEEVGFCLLGGFGIKLEVAEAYHSLLISAGAYSDPYLSNAEILAILLEPAVVSGRPTRYRFPNQRAERLSSSLPRLAAPAFQTRDPLGLRKALMSIPGIGPKTASWIVRNWLGSADVAILDIHVIRACQLMGVFPSSINLNADYDDLEARFLEFSRNLSVRPSILDAVIWNRMREFSPSLIKKLT